MKQDFQYLVDTVMQDPGLEGLRPVVEKELLHHELLFIMERGGFLDDLTFQGGTSLRLCHGAPRFSEDLDFSGGPGFEVEQMAGLADALESGLAERCGLDAAVTLPKSSRRRPLSAGVSVSSWRIGIRPPSGRRDLPTLRVKLDIDNAPSHTREVRGIGRHYDALPDLDMLIAVQSREEILASKLVAFPASVATRNRPRYRDVWDMRWLRSNGTEIRAELVRAKMLDHRTPPSWLENAVGRAGEIVRSPAFSAELRRFVSRDAARETLDNRRYMEFLAQETERLLDEAVRGLEQEAQPGNEPDLGL